jgi:cobalt-zinc-cadmium efflux system outer membrane protein
MNLIPKYLLLALLIVGCSPRVLAQVAVERSSARTLALDEALRRSLRYNPEIAKLDATLADKLGRAIEAEVKLNPSFKVGGGYVSEEAGKGGAFEFEIEQPLRPSDFGLRKTYAAALRAAANLEQKADVLRVLNEVALIYYRAWALQERAALLGNARAQAEDVLATIQQQLEAGQSSVSQRSIFEAETARFAAELIAVRGERAGAQAELAGATGIAAAELRLVRPLFGTPPSVEELSAFAESRSGVRRIALARRAAAAKNLRVARADAVFPEFAPGVDASYARPERALDFGVTIAARIPIWDRNQGEITRARGALTAAERELESIDRVSFDRETRARRQQLLDLQARVDAFRDQVIPAYRAAYQETLAQFRAGQASTLQLFEVQKSLIEAQEKAFDYVVETLSARTHLEQHIGGRLEEVRGSRRDQQSR